jgi:hypothetical protein
MMKIAGSLFVVTALFAGCAADVGAPTDEVTDTKLDTVTQASPVCPSVIGTLDEHVLGGRATKTVTPFFFWQITTYYAARGPGSSLAQENLGSDGNQRVILYATDPTGLTFTANSALVDANACQKVECGNGKLDDDEVCDGAVLRDPSCADYRDDGNYASGTLKCTADCKYDVSACVRPACGNGVVEQGETCDGANLGSFKPICADNGDSFVSGNVKCGANCLIDVSACVKKCGDGKLEAGEACDGNLFAPPFDTATSRDCRSRHYGGIAIPWGGYVSYASGQLTCSATCFVVEDQCKPTPGCYDISGKLPRWICF